MKNVFRNFSVVILVLFAISMTGCLSSKTEQAPKNNVNKPVVDPVKPPVDPKPTGGDTSKLPVYVPSDKERPQLLKLEALNIDEPTVQKGQTVKFAAEALTGKYPVTIEYAATGGKIDSNGNWTAPDKAGYYQVMAYAVDKANNLKSDPMTIELRVAKAGNSGIVLSSAPAIIKDGKLTNGPKRTITVNDTTTAQNVSRYILNTDVAGATNTTATVQLVFTDSNNNHIISPSFEYGTLTFKGETQAGTTYTATYEYKAPATVPTSGRANIEFSIFNPSNSDSDTATVSFIINTQPTISTVQFTSAPEVVIGLGKTRTIKVTSSDADQALFGDKLSYTYTIISGGGTLSTGDGGSNLTGEVDYTAPNTAGTLILLVLAQDTRGASYQKTSTFYIQNPMSMVVADSGITGAAPNGESEKYAEAIGDNAAKYKLLTKGAATQVRWMIGNNSNLNADMGADAYYYFKDTAVARASQSVVWSVYNEYSTSTAISAFDNLYLTTNGLVTDMNDTTGYNFDPNGNTATALGRGGIKTIKARTTATDPVSGAPVTVESTDTVLVNEFPYITGVTFKDAQGNTQNLFNGSTVNMVQVPYDQTFTFSVSVFDADNDRISPTVADYAIGAAGSKGLWQNIATTAENVSGIRIENDFTVAPSLNAPANGTADTNIIKATTVPVAGSYATTVTDYSVTVPKNATIDSATTFHYMYLHVTDGYGQAVDAALAGATNDFYRVGMEMAVADTNARSVDIGTVAGMTSYNKNLCLEFVDVSGVINAKIKDLDTNTYWTKGDGSVISIPMNAATSTSGEDANLATSAPASIAAGAAYVDLDTTTATLNENVDWLAIEFAAANRANWKAGDKVYFKTYANTVVLKYQVVQGARITGVDAPMYVTLGDTVEIRVAGSVSGTSTSASVTITEPSNASGGTLEVGNDTDGDTISNEVWTFKAPSTMPTNKTVTFQIKITDSLGNVSVFPKTIELNRKPVLTGVQDSDGMSVMSGDYWVLTGVNNLKLVADATDPDGASDVLKYDWGLSSTYGTLSNLTQPVTYWSPMPGGTFLTGSSGPNADGKIPFSIAARDFDKNNQPKGGYSGLKSFTIGVNDPPTVGTLGSLGGAESATNGIDFDATPKYANSTYNVGINNATLDDSVVDRNSLNFQWYIIDTATGKIAQDIGTVYTAADTVNALPAQKFYWIPNAGVRKLGGTYALHARVTDDKTGAAKGITDVSLNMAITADATAPVVLPANISVVELIDLGTNDVYGIGDKIRFKVNLNNAPGNLNTVDIEKATMLIGDLIDGAGGNLTTVNMSYSDNGTPSNYTDDYIYYDHEIKIAAAAANAVDSAALTNVDLTATDIAGNTAAAGVDLGAAISIDNYIDLNVKALAAANVVQNNNANTGLPFVLNTLHIGDELVFEDNAGEGLQVTTDDVTPYASGALMKLDGTRIGLSSAIDSAAVTDAVNNGFTYPTLSDLLILREYKSTVYSAVQFNAANQAAATTKVIPFTLTDNAGNKVTQYMHGAGTYSLDLKRPEVSSVKMYSYRVVAGAANDIYTEKDGTTYTTNTGTMPAADLSGGTIAAASLADDNDDTTMEIMAITFDETMTVGTLNEMSIQVNLMTVPKVSLSKGATANDAGAAAVGTFTLNKNYHYDAANRTLYIALVGDLVDTSRHIPRNSVVEVLFNDNTTAILSEAAGNRPYAVVADTNANEIDYTKDYSDGQLQGYLQW